MSRKRIYTFLNDVGKEVGLSKLSPFQDEVFYEAREIYFGWGLC